MKNSVNSNMYETTLNSIWSLYGEYIHGERQAFVVILSSAPLSTLAHSALQSSFERLRYGKAAVTFVQLSLTPDSISLSSKELCVLLEGLDPKILIICDKKAAHVCARSYHQEISLDTRLRIFGREARVFSSFEALLTNPSNKQKAWALLKSLPKLSS